MPSLSLTFAKKWLIVRLRREFLRNLRWTVGQPNPLRNNTNYRDALYFVLNTDDDRVQLRDVQRWLTTHAWISDPEELPRGYRQGTHSAIGEHSYARCSRAPEFTNLFSSPTLGVRKSAEMPILTPESSLAGGRISDPRPPKKRWDRNDSSGGTAAVGTDAGEVDQPVNAANIQNVQMLLGRTSIMETGQPNNGNGSKTAHEASILPDYNAPSTSRRITYQRQGGTAYVDSVQSNSYTQENMSITETALNDEIPSRESSTLPHFDDVHMNVTAASQAPIENFMYALPPPENTNLPYPITPNGQPEFPTCFLDCCMGASNPQFQPQSSPQPPPMTNQAPRQSNNMPQPEVVMRRLQEQYGYRNEDVWTPFRKRTLVLWGLRYVVEKYCAHLINVEEMLPLIQHCLRINSRVERNLITPVSHKQALANRIMEIKREAAESVARNKPPPNPFFSFPSILPAPASTTIP